MFLCLVELYSNLFEIRAELLMLLLFAFLCGSLLFEVTFLHGHTLTKRGHARLNALHLRFMLFYCVARLLIGLFCVSIRALCSLCRGGQCLECGYGTVILSAAF